MDLIFSICNGFFLLIFALFDVLNKRIIPNYITIPYVLFSFLTLFFRDDPLPYALGFAEFCLILGIIWVYSRIRKINLLNAIGGADLKVFLGLSISSGVTIFNSTLIISSFLGIVFALTLKKRKITFLPFLFLGYLLVIIFLFLGKMVLTYP
jgi:Flp pilus assembly protein protease CpaA